jgi:hypothetical protein
MSTPWSSSAFAASASFAGSYQEFAQTILILTFGFTDWAPRK